MRLCTVPMLRNPAGFTQRARYASRNPKVKDGLYVFRFVKRASFEPMMAE